MKFDFELKPNTYNKRFEIKDNFKPIVSIITPFFNSGEYINETVNSVLSQSFPWFEWIIVDDGSTDKKSLEKLKEISKLDFRIKIFHKKNGGPSDTRNYGTKKMCKSSKYILFLDDDDLIEQNFIECTYFALKSNKEASFAYTDSVGFGTQEYVWAKNFDINQQLKDNILVATALIKKEDYELVGGYDLKEKGIYEDWIFWTKLFAKNKIPVRLNYIGFWYRKKNNGELSRSFDNRKITQKYLDQYIKDVNLDLKAIQYPKDNYDWDDVNKPSHLFNVISPIKYNTENIIMILPHIVMGGADKFCIDLLKGLNKKYSVSVVFTTVKDNNWLQELKKYVDDYYILPSFLERRYWNEFIEYLIKKNNSKMIFNTNSVYGYMCLPYLKSKFPNIKIIDYIHMEEWYNRNGGYSRDSKSVTSVIDLTMTCNKNSENILHDYFGVDPKKTKTVYIGVDEEKFKNDLDVNLIKEKYNVDKTKKVISFIARISYQKRPYLLVRIIKKFVEKRKDSVFLICGDGELLDDLKSRIKQEGLNSYVEFLGSIKEPKEIYAISDVTLNCSIKEGLALTTYESLSMGVPVVSSAVGGQGEIIDDSVGAIIPTLQKEEDIYDYNYRDEEIDAFVNNLNRILDDDSYKSNCRKKILNGFTINQMTDNMNKIIDTVISNKSTSRFDNTDIALELLNQYLLEDTSSYEWQIKFYKGELDYSYKPDNSPRAKITNFLKKVHLYKFAKKIYTLLGNCKFKIQKISAKLHIYQEMRIIYKIIKLILLIPFTIVLILIYCLLLPYTIIKKIINCIKSRIH